MFFSIIVPVYNVERYLRQCLDSIRSQSFRDFEAILVDDGSTDSSSRICEEYREDNRFTVIHKSNGGLVSARKAGTEIAKGDYIINVDSDDFIEKDLLDRLYRAAESLRPDLIAYGYKTVDRNGTVLSERVNDFPTGSYTGDDLERLKGSYLYDKERQGLNGGSLIFSIWTKAVRREIYVECQPRIDDRIEKGEDLLVGFHILRIAKSALVTEIKGYCYRLQQASMTHVINEADIGKQAILNHVLLELTETDRKYRNQALVCIFYTSYERIQRLACSLKSYREYRKMTGLVERYGLFESTGEMVCTKPSTAERFKISIIRHKLWILLYLYFKRYRE